MDAGDSADGGGQGPGSLFAAFAEAAASADSRRQLRRRCYAQVARHAAGRHDQGLQRAANRMRSGLPAAKQARGLQRRGGGGASLFTVAGQARACIEKLMILHRSCTVPSDHDLQ